MVAAVNLAVSPVTLENMVKEAAHTKETVTTSATEMREHTIDHNLVKVQVIKAANEAASRHWAWEKIIQQHKLVEPAAKEEVVKKGMRLEEDRRVAAIAEALESRQAAEAVVVGESSG